MMTGVTKFLIVCSTVALPLAVGALPLAAAAQSNAAGYCEALSTAYRTTVPKVGSPTATVPVAMAKCAAGDTADGIPVLEQALRDARVTLPKRS
jgi:hypothetical protein